MQIPHPVIVTESGRATVAYSSMLLFNILNVNRGTSSEPPPPLPADSPDALKNLYFVQERVNLEDVQECYNDALFYRDELRELFHRGQASVRERALAESVFLDILQRIALIAPTMDRIPPELKNLPDRLADIY